MYELYILTQPEFQILAVSKDIRKMYGIKPAGILDEDLVMYEIHEMVSKGILREKGASFVICAPYDAMIDTIKKSEAFLSVQSAYEEFDDISFYYDDPMVTSYEESRQDEESVKLGIFKIEEMQEALQDRGFLPENPIDPDIALILNDDGLIRELSEAKELVVFSIIYRDGAGKAHGTVALIKWKAQYWIKKMRPGLEEPEYVIYDKSVFYEILIKMLKGEEI